jgi:predicted phage terminase large subunit-like protein
VFSDLWGRLGDKLETDWQSIARPEQIMPPGDWAIWLVLAGRGWGKTRTGAEAIRAVAEAGSVSKIALVGPTFGSVRDIMIACLLSIAPNSCRPLWEPSKARLVYPNGVEAWALSSAEPERIRGFEVEIAWCDELCAWERGKIDETWDMLQMTLRKGRRPRRIVTTTPKPLPLLRALLKRNDIVVTRGKTIDNAKNLAPTIMQDIVERYQGTRLGRQELDAEVLLDIENALFTHEMIDTARKPRLVPHLERVVVAVDPSGTSGAGDSGDAIGIVAAGKGSDGRCYVLADWTLKASPDVWGRRAVEAYRYFNADRVVAERNFGGAMVENVLRTVDASISYKEVTASRGKVQRAEPVAALYEQGRVTHVDDKMTDLETQMLAMTSQGYQGDRSPDRADALVWALTDLMLSAARPQFIWGGLEPRSELEIARIRLNTDRYRSF